MKTQKKQKRRHFRPFLTPNFQKFGRPSSGCENFIISPPPPGDLQPTWELLDGKKVCDANLESTKNSLSVGRCIGHAFVSCIHISDICPHTPLQKFPDLSPPSPVCIDCPPKNLPHLAFVWVNFFSISCQNNSKEICESQGVPKEFWN